MLRGEVLIFERVNAKWVHHSTIENSYNRYLSYFGFYVALETKGDILRVGFYDTDNIAYTRLYKRQFNDWIPFKRFKFDVKNLKVSEMETPF